MSPCCYAIAMHAALVRPFTYRILRAAFFHVLQVHIFPDAKDDLDAVSHYPLAGICMLAGIILLVVVENVIHKFFGSTSHSHLHPHPHPPHHHIHRHTHTHMHMYRKADANVSDSQCLRTPLLAAAESQLDMERITGDSHHSHCHANGSCATAAATAHVGVTLDVRSADETPLTPGLPSDPTPMLGSSTEPSCLPVRNPISQQVLLDTGAAAHVHCTDRLASSRTSDPGVALQPRTPHHHHHGGSHTHECLREISPSHWVVTVNEEQNSVRSKVMAYVMELGCIFHSVLIGIGLGVTSGEKGPVVALIIALTFHQMMEGISLGSVVAASRFPLFKSVCMILCYAITTPLGVTVGIAVSSTYDETTLTARAVQGVLNGISAGMLLYIALIQQISEEFTRKDLASSTKAPLRLMMYAAVLLGSFSMCVLAMWS